MANLANLTRFAAIDLPSIDRDGADLIVVCVAGRFELPPVGSSGEETLKIADEQPPPPSADVFWGDPAASSVKYEGQSAYCRLATDVYLNGSARPPRGRAVGEMRVTLRVGPAIKEIQVYGDRVWRGAVVTLTPSIAAPFVEMPLFYERSFGGNLPAGEGRKAQWEPRNPVGRGLYRDASEAHGQPLPNLEDPRHLITRWSDRPGPVGFGPIARTWQPRCRYAGTADQKWIDERCPLWPFDMSEEYFQAAAPGLAISPYLEGGELVSIDGVSYDGTVRFAVPRRRLLLKSVFKHRVDHRLMTLDALLIEPDDGAVTLMWRAAVDVSRQMHLHQHCVVRELEPWEANPA